MDLSVFIMFDLLHALDFSLFGADLFFVCLNLFLLHVAAVSACAFADDFLLDFKKVCAFAVFLLGPFGVLINCSSSVFH